MAVSKDLFVSYSREDTVKGFVQKLKRDLEGAQVSVWLDVEDIPSGTEEPLAIAIAFTALSNCKALIAILTKNYISSRFCKSELYFACRTDQKPIFPVVREEGWEAAAVSEECSEGVKYMKAACNWVSFLPSDDYGLALHKLVQNVNKQVTGPLPPQPRPPPTSTTFAPTKLALKEVQNELSEVTRWHPLGVQLGLTPGTLNSIESNHRHDAQRCTTEVIIWWLQNEQDATWEKLAHALEAMRGHDGLVRKLREKAHSKGAVVTPVTGPLPPQPQSPPTSTRFGHLGKHKQRPPSPEANNPSNRFEQQQKKRRMSPQCHEFVKLISKLSRILSKDPESVDVLASMKLALATLKGQDESIAIEPEVYQDTETVTQFFTVMAKYWNCYDDHDLLVTLIDSTENEEAIRVLNSFLQSRNPRRIIPTEKCPEAPFKSPCLGRSNDSTTAFVEKEKDVNSLGDSLPQIADTQHRFFSISQQIFPPEEVESLQHFHYHPGCSNELPRNRVPVLADIHFNQMNGQTYNYVKSNVATVLNTPRPAMSLHGVYEGSCVIVWHVSKQIAAGIKRIQLSSNDKEMLLKCKVLNLSCGEKCLFEIAREELQEMVTSGKIPAFAEPVEVEELCESLVELGQHILSGCRVSKLIQHCAGHTGYQECVWTSDGEYECKLREEGEAPTMAKSAAEHLVPEKDPDTSLSPLSPPSPPSVTEKQSGKKEVTEERKSIREVGQVLEFKRCVRVITSDKEFERELRLAKEALVMVDFTDKRSMWTVYIDLVYAMLKIRYTEAKFLSVDVEQCKDTATKYDVHALPTYAFFRNRKLLRMCTQFHGSYCEPVATIKYFLDSKEEEKHSLVRSISSDEEFEHELRQTGEILVVVDFTADWCGWSVIMNPINAMFSEHFTAAHFLQVDSMKCRRAAKMCEVKSFPTFAFFRKGELLDKFSGANPEKLVVKTRHFLDSKGTYSPGKGRSFMQVIVNDKQFERELRQSGETLVVASFTVDGSRWSKFTDPVFVVLSEHYPAARFLLVHADKCQSTAIKYHVEEIPTFAFFRKANLLYKFSGPHCEILAARIKYYLEGKGAEEGRSKEQLSSVIVDPSQPTTKLKIKLADGSKLIETFNYTHTVGDLRHLISRSRPELAASSYALTTFPNKELTDDTQTLAGADLFDTVVTQETDLEWK